jgi:hypothetical protein
VRWGLTDGSRQGLGSYTLLAKHGRASMDLHVFKGESGVVAVGRKRDASGLPSAHGPWRYIKPLIVNRGDGPRIGASSDSIIDNIEKQGFHLWPEGTDADRT